MALSCKLKPAYPMVWSFALVGLLFVAGCSKHSIQTTSGKAYLEKHGVTNARPERPALSLPASRETLTFDQALRQVADIEPTLSFPARIGIAKIGCDRERCDTVASLDPNEARAWADMAVDLDPSFGTIVPLHPLALRQALTEAERAGLDLDRTTVIDDIRLGAARQHLDGIIIYETVSQSEATANLLALGDLTIIGAFVLPSRKIESTAYAAGIIIDPLSGYPYGQVEAAASNNDRFTTSVSSSSNREDAERAATIDATKALAAEAKEALHGLKSAIAEQAAIKASSPQ